MLKQGTIQKLCISLDSLSDKLNYLGKSVDSKMISLNVLHEGLFENLQRLEDECNVQLGIQLKQVFHYDTIMRQQISIHR